MVKQGMYTCLSNRKLARDTYEMKLCGDTSAIERPGQFVNILISGQFLRRPLSVCDWDEETITLIYKVVGEGTKKLADAKKGDGFDLLAGLGNGYSVVDTIRAPLLVGGGVGVPPLYGLCKAFLARGVVPRVYLGFRAAEDVFYREEFSALGCAPEIALGNEFVTDRIAAKNPPYDAYYTCGPEPMLRAVFMSLRRPGQLSFEARMGCGFGACVGCTCRTITGYKRICAEGPVLNADELAWGLEEKA
ncbi:MAG: dihydroorotate dehydrogenase electron transfer subunit [Clostridiaceae bacterium]|nr:dihydroorotate dehydrogenase electron transfer subunit [Clostridiaceae bacterium]